MKTRTIEQVITCSQDVLGGIPVFAGTRVPLKNLIDYLKAGESIDQFLDDFPTVTREQVTAALELAQEALLAEAHEHIAG